MSNTNNSSDNTNDIEKIPDIQLPEVTANHQLSWFIYYIPSGRGIVNPSAALRSRALRIDLSGWIIPSNDIPWDIYKTLTDAGATVTCAKFDLSETPKLLKQAIAFSQQELKEALERMQKSADDAENVMNHNEDNNVSRDESHTKFVKHQKLLIKRSAQLLKDVDLAFKRFALNAREYLNLRDAANFITGLDNGMKAKADAYSKATNELRLAVGEDNEMVRSARRSDVPADILADYMDDSGVDASGLREVFSEPTDGAEGTEGVYSLADAETVAAG